MKTLSTVKKGLFILFVSCVAVFSCKKEDQIHPVVINNTNVSLTVVIDTITQTNAFIHWKPDSVSKNLTYSIILNQDTVIANITFSNYVLENLKANTSYSGQIIAKTTSGLTKGFSFNFTTEDAITRFSKSYSIPNNSSVDARHVINTPDGGYITAGFSSTDGTNLAFLKIDSLGKEQWHNYFPIYRRQMFVGLQFTGDGYIGATNYYIVKLDLNGNKVWDKTIDFNSIGTGDLRSIVKYNDGYMIAGMTGESNGSNPASEAVIINMDLNGNIRWQKSYGSRLFNEADDILADAVGNFYVAGVTAKPGLTYNDLQLNNPASNFWWFKIDQNGNMLWEKLSDRSDYFDTGARLVHTKDGNYGFVGSMEVNYVGIGNIEVIKFDPAGNKLNEAVFSDPRLSIFGESIAFTNDGGFIVTGYGDTGATMIMILYKFDSNWKQTWGKALNIDDGSYGFDILQTKDNGYFIAGAHSNFYNGHVWALKTDAEGLYKKY